MNKIGIFVGDFNSITNAHLMVANESLKLLNEVWFCPFFSENYTQKVDMIKLAIGESKEKKFKCIECAIDEFNDFNNLNDFLDNIDNNDESVEFVLLVGVDTYLKMPTWKKALEINKKYKFIIAKRGEKDDFDKKNEDIIIDCFSTISSKIVRERVNNNKNTKFLIPNSVISYIKKNKIKY